MFDLTEGFKADLAGVTAAWAVAIRLIIFPALKLRRHLPGDKAEGTGAPYVQKPIRPLVAGVTGIAVAMAITPLLDESFMETMLAVSEGQFIAMIEFAAEGTIRRKK